MNNFEKIFQLLSEKVKNPEDIVPEAKIRQLGIDSLDLVDMMLEVEQELGITFADEELLDIETVQDAVSLLDQKVNQ